MYTYLFINLLTVLIPAVLSFEHRIRYYQKWKYFFPAASLTGLVFIAWDHYFTVNGIWGFNGPYLIGWTLFGLPIEEILFFFCVPFSCLFIYELVCHFQKKDPFGPKLRLVLKIAVLILTLTGLWHFDKAYTSTTFLLLAMLLVIHLYILRPKYLSHFVQMYLISLIPFLIINGILTNGLPFVDAGPVVWYNNAENLSIRVLNIPIEDFMYSMLLLLLNTTLYEYFKKK